LTFNALLCRPVAPKVVRRTYVELLAVDAILLIVAYFVLQNMQWKVNYAASPHSGTTGYSTSFSYSLFTQVFVMGGGSLPLSSPVTLDWLQVIAVALVVINGWYLYRRITGPGVELPASRPSDSPSKTA
jgi:hypothetical protein